MTRQYISFMGAKGVKEAVTYLKSLAGRDGIAKICLNTETNKIEVYHCINVFEHLGDPYVELFSWTCHAEYGVVAPVPTMAKIKNAIAQYDEYLAWTKDSNNASVSFESYKEFIG